MNEREVRLRAKLNMAFVLVDIAESYLLEVEQYLGEDKAINSQVKELYRKATIAVRKIVESVSIEENIATELGEWSDVLRELIDKVLKDTTKNILKEYNS